MPDLGKALAAARSDKGWSLRQAGAVTGIHNAHLSQIEKGVIQRPSPTVLFTLAEAYSLDFGELMRMAGLSQPDDAAALGAAFRTLQDLSPHEMREAVHFMQSLKSATPSVQVMDPLQSVNGFAKKRIRQTTETILVKAGVAGSFPTNLQAISNLAGISETIDIGNLPSEVTAKKPRWLGRMIGALLFRERVVFIDRKQSSGRQRFTEAHELTHKVLPWHERSYCLDDDRIFRDVEDYLDLEANVGATALLFQNHRFHEVAVDYETSIDTPILLAELFGTSFHASIRYYVEYHPYEVGLLITGQYPRATGRLPIWTTVESEAFRRRFGPVGDIVPVADLRSTVEAEIPVARLVTSARNAAGKVTEEVSLTDLGGDKRRFIAECWFNQHSYFLTLVPKSRIRLGKQIVVQARD